MGTSSIRSKKTQSRRASATDTFLESIARGLGPLLRRVSKEVKALCYRDPTGEPVWFLCLDDHHLCEVRVVSQPDLHLNIIGFWINSVNRRVTTLTPFTIPLDQNGKEMHGSLLYILMLVMFGRLIGLSQRAAQARRG
jgi:hypothetical protein